MTRAEISVQILSEVSGRSKKEIQNPLNTFREYHPEGKWDEEIPEPKAQELLSSLRKEAPGILAWLIKGAIRVERSKGTA